MKEAFWAILAVSVIATFPRGASADFITSPDGEYQVGISQYGTLYDPVSKIGLKRVSDGLDVISPGIPREAYSVDSSTSSIVAAVVDPALNIIWGAVVQQTSFQASGAFVRTLLYDRAQLDQNFVFAANNVLAIQSTVTNVGNYPLRTLYRRTVDFDVFPTQANEIVRVDPYPARFPEPISAATAEAYETAYASMVFDNQSPTSGETRQGELGGAFNAVVGFLQPGQSASFTIYYGLNLPGQSVTDLRKQVKDLGATFQISATSSNTTGDVNSAVLAYGPAIPNVNPVPAPAGLILGVFGVGLVSLSRWVRRSAGRAAGSE